MARPESVDRGDGYPPTGLKPLIKGVTRQYYKLKTVRDLFDFGRIGTERRHLPTAPKEQDRTPNSKVIIDGTLQMFPDLSKRWYIVPPVHFNRVFYLEHDIGGDTMKILQPYERMSDVRFDECHQRIHSILSSMCERLSVKRNEVMTICFSLVFDNYLNSGGKKNPSSKKHRSSPYRIKSDREIAIRSTPLDNSSARHQKCDHPKDTSHSYNMNIQKEVALLEGNLIPLPLSDLDLYVFPRPRDIGQRGELDIIMIHPQLGLIIAEIKTMGDAFELQGNSLTLLERQSMICRKLRAAQMQLRRQAETLRYLVSDICPDIPVTKVLILPNLKMQVVREAIEREPDLEQSFCEMFVSQSLTEALQKCIFSEQLPPIGHCVSTDHDVTEELINGWWMTLTSANNSSHCDTDYCSLPDTYYQTIVSRFCGPATKQYVRTAHRPRAEVSTLAQAVQETASCFTAPVLTQQQVQILGQQSPRVLLSGPPGTGKTLMLILKAKEWLRQGHRVMVISLWTSSHAVSCYINHQVEQEVTWAQREKLVLVLKKEADFGEVIKGLKRSAYSPSCKSTEMNSSLDSGFGEYDDKTDETAQLTERAGLPELDLGFEEHSGHPTSRPQDITEHGQKLHVLVPEAPWFLDILLLVLEKFLGKDGFVIWVSTSSPGLPTASFASLELTQNLRCPPVVVREMMMTPAFRAFDRPRYISQDAGVLSGMPYPTDGPRVKRIQHYSHREISVWDCELCGDAVATFLTRELRIVARTSKASALSGEPEDRLYFTDVLISGYLPHLGTFIRASKQPRTTPMQFEISSESTDPQFPTAGFLKGLRRKGIRYDIMDKDDIRSYQKLAVPEDGDGVQVAAAELLKGVERKVVVVVGTADLSAAVPCYVDPLYDVMGCCTSQLIMVGGDETDMFPEDLKNVTDTCH